MKRLFVFIVIMFVLLVSCETTKLAVRDPHIQITDMAFCVEQATDYQEYTPRPTSRFLLMEIAWVYIEIGNVTDMDGKIWLIEKGYIYDESGQEIRHAELLNYHDYLPLGESVNKLYLNNWLNFRALMLSPGKHTYEVEVIDGYTGKSDKRKLDFVIVGGRDC